MQLMLRYTSMVQIHSTIRGIAKCVSESCGNPFAETFSPPLLVEKQSQVIVTAKCKFLLCA